MKQTGIIYLTTSAPSRMSDELMLAGFRVWEALSESEVQHLCDTEDIDALVIAHEVSWRQISWRTLAESVSCWSRPPRRLSWYGN